VIEEDGDRSVMSCIWNTLYVFLFTKKG